MIVVADTSPLNYLVLVGAEHTLGSLFTEVVIPSAVRDELLADAAPTAVRKWMGSPPDWLRVVDSAAGARIAGLNPGESEAITLALAMRADMLLIDERAGRAEAYRRGLEVTGTLGVLAAAAKRGMIDPIIIVSRLKTTSFRATEEQYARVIAAR
ncbi:MAG: DUF3368 domain-containing protein [Phycisphaerales bacterium]